MNLQALTLEEIEIQVARLPLSGQLKLAARICERLSECSRAAEPACNRPQLSEMEAWLADCDALAESVNGACDAVAELRQLRDE